MRGAADSTNAYMIRIKGASGAKGARAAKAVRGNDATAAEPCEKDEPSAGEPTPS